jgi:hypothetical protein
LRARARISARTATRRRDFRHTSGLSTLQKLRTFGDGVAETRRFTLARAVLSVG